jgi:pSer/pThr/pTyr-binding forkhead associated (FHA) protein
MIMKMGTGTVHPIDTRIAPPPRVVLEDAADPALWGGRGAGRDGHISPIAEHPSLIVYGGPEDGAAIPILKRNITMGCLPDNDIVVDGDGVARRHAEIFQTRAGYYLRDLGVANPTFLNRHDIGGLEQPLRHGDRIQLARSTILHVFTHDGGIPREPMAPPPISRDLHGVSLAPGGPPEAGNGFGCSPEYGCEPENRDSGAQGLGRLVEAELYEGAVRLDVGIEGKIWLVVNFVTELRRNTQLRVLRLQSNPLQGVEIWLALREPIPLKEILGQMEEVTLVGAAPEHEAGSNGQEQVLNVRLNWDLRQDR